MAHVSVTEDGRSRTEQRLWTSDDAASLYRIADWADGYFDVSPRGRVTVCPEPDATPAFDIFDVVNHLRWESDLTPPVLLRFPDVLRGRVARLNEAFRDAIEEYDYPNRYTTVYPIKVNQLRQVVEGVLDAGDSYDVGLECGSKAELIAALGHLQSDERLLVCNGYKDHDMLRLILDGQRLGKSVIPVVERYPEFETLLHLADERSREPRFGVRVLLGTDGAGKWAASAGDGAKFGMQIAELLQLVRRLETEGRSDALDLLHFHIGSQVNDIQTLRKCVREIAEIYAQLQKRGLSIEFLDVGGGLGVRYGSGSAMPDHDINYTLREYANSVVGNVHEVCAREGVSMPRLLSESGRAVTAHHTVLVVEAVGSLPANGSAPRPDDPEDHPLLDILRETSDWVEEMERTRAPRKYSLLEAYHDAREAREQAGTLFEMGYLSLDQKAWCEQTYGDIRRRIFSQVARLDTEEVPDELARLGDRLVDQYVCSFSIFQSLLDHWAISQPFPVMPLHRLDEQPSRRAVLVDLTCDSDGKITQYVAGSGAQRYLDVHPLREGEPYYLGIFLTGAYQDIMGDVHNLLGRLPEAHVYGDAGEPDGFRIENVLLGDSVQTMLAHVQYLPEHLRERMESIVREKVEERVIPPEEGTALLARYHDLFDGTTYFDPSGSST